MKSLIGSLCIFWGIAFLVLTVCDIYISLIPLGIIAIGAILIVVDNYRHYRHKRKENNLKNKINER